MKRVRINVGKVGSVQRNGDYNRMITAGVYWLGFNEEVTFYDMALLYKASTQLDIRLQDPKFTEMVEVIEIGDNEIALKYNGRNFESIILSGRYFQFNGLSNFRFEKIDLATVEMDENKFKSILEKTEVKAFVKSFTVETYEEGLLLIDNKFVRKLLKGTYNFWKSIKKVEVLKADMRQLQLEISGQEMLTKDKAALRVNFYTQYKVLNIERALLNNRDFEKQLYILIQLALRAFIGKNTLDELLENKEEITNFVIESLKEKAEKLGVEILNAGIRDVILPGEVKDIMNHVLVAQKTAQANIITRREETASTRSLLNTAKLMEDNTMLYKLKEMEYIEKIAGKIGEITVSGNGKVVDQLKQIFTK